MDFMKFILKQRGLFELQDGSRPWRVYDIQTCLCQVRGNPFHSLINFKSSWLFLKLGSWEGDIRIWKIDAKLNSFSLVGKIAAPGVVNSLQLLSMPKGFSKTITWGSSTSQAGKEVVMVAGLGQEAKLGRWLTVKEGGAVNQALVVVV